MSLAEQQESLLQRISKSAFIGKDLHVDDTFKMAFFNYHNLLSCIGDPLFLEGDNKDYVLATVSRKAAEIAKQAKSKALDANAFYKATMSFYGPIPKICFPEGPKGCHNAAAIILSDRGAEKVDAILQGEG